MDDNASEEEIEDMIRHCADIATEFIKDYIFMVPTAKQTENATAPNNLVVLITAGTRVYATTADAEYEKVIRATDKKSVGEIGVERLSKFMDNLNNGAFAINEYQKAFWLSEEYKDMAPEFCENTDVKTMLREITELISK
jgi:hypothetical protein